MSLSLGEKLRQAREKRGLSISEVAEQTRISPLYLQSIENDDYKILPGGIFNKGFVKSFAKFVGVDEQEALEDYSKIISHNERNDGDDLRVFRPEVLTDDRSAASMAPTIIIAAIILALMTIGILFLVDYMRQPTADVAANNPALNSNATPSPPAESQTTSTALSNVPEMGSLKVEFTAISEPVSLLAVSDGKTSSNTVAPGTSVSFEPKESLRLSYSRSLASVVQLTINGKKLELPAQPEMPRRNAIEFEINKQNLGKIWQTGTISWETVSADQSSSIANTATSESAVPAASRPTALRPERQPTPAGANLQSNAADGSPRSSAVTGNSASSRPATNQAPTPDEQ